MVLKIIFWCSAVFYLVLCGCDKKKNDDAVLAFDQLVGTWQNTEFVQLPVIVFNKDGTYILKFLRKNLEFTGNYHVSGNMLRVLDFYCGTGVPGIYRFSIKGEDLAFECMDDPKCDRHVFFPQKWKRLK